MDILLNSLSSHAPFPIDQRHYDNIILDYHTQKDQFHRTMVVNYIIHGINKEILDVDLLFFASVLNCPIVEKCYSVGLFIRLGANINEYFEGRHIISFITEMYYKENNEVFMFILTMLLISGFSYSSFIYENNNLTIAEYFDRLSMPQIFLRNVKFENQKLLNLYMDENLTGKKFSYRINELIDNFSLKLLGNTILPVIYENGEDSVLRDVVKCCNFNMFRLIFESRHKVTYFTLDRICAYINYNGKNEILTSQLIEILKYLNKKQVFLDKIQYRSIKHVVQDLNTEDSKPISDYVRTLFSMFNVKIVNIQESLEKINMKHDYLKYLNKESQINTLYKSIYYRIKETNIRNVIMKL